MIPHIIHYCWFGNKKIPNGKTSETESAEIVTSTDGIRNSADEGKIRNISELINKAVSEKTAYPQKADNARHLIEERFEIKRCTEILLKKYMKICSRT